MFEPLEENLVDEVTRLVGRPQAVVREAISRALAVLVAGAESEDLATLAPFPMTAWQALAPASDLARESWSAALSAGLTIEEVFTAFAVIDDHVRRRFGNAAWAELADWGPRLARQYEFDGPRRAPGGRPGAEPGLGATV